MTPAELEQQFSILCPNCSEHHVLHTVHMLNDVVNIFPSINFLQTPTEYATAVSLTDSSLSNFS